MRSKRARLRCDLSPTLCTICCDAMTIYVHCPVPAFAPPCLRLRFRARRANQPHRLPPTHPARRRGCQDAFPDPPAHAAPCLWVQARQRRPRHAGLAALSGAQEHSAHGQVHRNDTRPVQGLLERLTLALGILVPPLPGAGKLGTTSASPSITLAAIPRCLISLSMASNVRSSCSSVIALTPPECSNFISRGTSMAQTLRYAAGDSRRTRLNTSLPCCCQRSASRALILGSARPALISVLSLSPMPRRSACCAGKAHARTLSAPRTFSAGRPEASPLPHLAYP